MEITHKQVRFLPDRLTFGEEFQRKEVSIMKRLAILFAVLVGLASIQNAARACDYVAAFSAPACYVAPPVQIQQSYSYAAPVQFREVRQFQQQSYGYAAPVQFQKAQFQQQSYGYSQPLQLQEVRFRSRSRSKGFSAQPVAVVPAPAIQVNVNNGRRGLLGFRR